MNGGWLYLLCSRTALFSQHRTVLDHCGGPNLITSLKKCMWEWLYVPGEKLTKTSIIKTVTLLSCEVKFLKCSLWHWHSPTWSCDPHLIFVCESGDVREPGPVLPCSQIHLLNTTLNYNTTAFLMLHLIAAKPAWWFMGILTGYVQNWRQPIV